MDNYRKDLSYLRLMSDLGRDTPDGAEEREIWVLDSKIGNIAHVP